RAIPLLESYSARANANGGDAYAENWLGFSYRKSGKLDQAFVHYDRALAIDPKHRGVHEYVGEAYLMVDNVAKAEEHLKVLDQLSFMPCDEYTQLKRSIARYKSEHKVATVKQ